VALSNASGATDAASRNRYSSNMAAQGRCTGASLEVFSEWISGHLLFGAGAVPIAEMDTTIAVTAEKSTSA
jgi:hypothetical protein